MLNCRLMHIIYAESIGVSEIVRNWGILWHPLSLKVKAKLLKAL